MLTWVLTPTADAHDVVPALPGVPGTGVAAPIAAIVVAAIASAALRRVRASLAPTGVLPALARGGEWVARLLVLGAGLALLAALAPGPLSPAVPWILGAAAVAVGWSARDLLPDLVARATLAVEGDLVPGVWIAGEGFEGRVARLGLRTTRIVDAFGDLVVVPNRALLHAPVRVSPVGSTSCAAEVRLDPALDPTDVRAALVEAAQLSPWLAPQPVEIAQRPSSPGLWSVQVRLLDGRHAAAFGGSLHERVVEVLEARRRAGGACRGGDERV